MRADQLQTGPFEIRAAWKWTILSPALAVLIVFTLTIFDPFGFESVTKRQSAIIIYKIYATLYPDKIRDNISVVLLDDATLKNWNEPWPPSHQLHGDVLFTLLSFEPAAVLVDIAFPYPREGDHFKTTEEVISKAKAPLFLVAAETSTGAPRPARQEILDLAESSGGRVQLVSADVGDLQQPLYPLSKDKEFKPAALAVYEAVCTKIKGATCPVHGLPNDNGEMEVAWGLRPAKFNRLRAADTWPGLYEDLFTSWYGRPVQLLWENVLPARWRQTDPLRIPYHAAISTDDLLDGGKRSQLDCLLRGKVVIYGAQVALQKDYVFSPVHGQIPGAFIHAMALDNLLTFGDRYIHRGAGSETFRREWTEFQPLALVLLAAIAISWYRHRLLQVDTPYRDAHMLREADERFLLGFRRILFGVALIVALVEFHFCISPFNWLALIVVVHVAHRVERWFFDPSAWRMHSART